MISIRSNDGTIFVQGWPGFEYERALRHNYTLHLCSLPKYESTDVRGRMVTRDVEFPLFIEDGFEVLTVFPEDLEHAFEFIRRMRRSFMRPSGLGRLVNVRTSLHLSPMDYDPSWTTGRIVYNMMDFIMAHRQLFDKEVLNLWAPERGGQASCEQDGGAQLTSNDMTLEKSVSSDVASGV